MGKKRIYGGSEDSPDACFGALGAGTVTKAPRPPSLRWKGAAEGRKLRVVTAPLGNGSCLGLVAIDALESVNDSTTPPSTSTAIEIHSGCVA